MPKIPHEAIVRLIQNAPAMIPQLLWPERAIGSSIHLGPAEITDLHLAEYRADAVILLGDDSQRPERAIIVEAQTDVDRDKEWTWPFYLSGLRVRLRCPTVLVVITVDREVERWSRQAIDLGDGCCTMRPYVIGPDDVPVITDVEVARAAPELAVLSVAAHAAKPDAEDVVHAALCAAQGLDRDRGIFYPDFILAFLKLAAPTLLEKIMSTARYEFHSDFARKYFSEGRTEGRLEGRTEGRTESLAEAVITLLEQRGFTVDATARAEILGCRDLDQLQAWLGRVLTAKSLDEVLGHAR